MTAAEDAARRELRARQGGGARYDAENAPGDDLLLARRGTAYFARKLNELSDAELDAPSLRPGWPRRRLIAHVCHQARSLALAVKALREPLIEEEADWRPDLALATTLPAHALRHLFDHSAKHLDVEWRDLPESGWEATLDVSGEILRSRDTPARRAEEIWMAAVELGNGGRWADLPDAFRPDLKNTDGTLEWNDRAT